MFKRKQFWCSFIEEYWPGQLDGTWIGRMEYNEMGKEGMFAEEVGIGTHDRAAVERLREKYDFKTVGKRTFQRLLKEIEEINRRRK